MGATSSCASTRDPELSSPSQGQPPLRWGCFMVERPGDFGVMARRVAQARHDEYPTFSPSQAPSWLRLFLWWNDRSSSAFVLVACRQTHGTQPCSPSHFPARWGCSLWWSEARRPCAQDKRAGDTLRPSLPSAVVMAGHDGQAQFVVAK